MPLLFAFRKFSEFRTHLWWPPCPGPLLRPGEQLRHVSWQYTRNGQPRRGLRHHATSGLLHPLLTDPLLLLSLHERLMKDLQNSPEWFRKNIGLRMFQRHLTLLMDIITCLHYEPPGSRSWFTHCCLLLPPLLPLIVMSS